MKNAHLETLLLSAAVAVVLVAPAKAAEESAVAPSLAALESQFAAPPDTFGVNCWWWWLNGNTDKDAIRSELAAMKSRHFQGAMIFDAGGQCQGGHRDVPAGPVFGGKEWCDLFVFSLDEAERHGLSIGFNIQSGWNLGGPCVKPEYAAKRVVASQVVVKGGSKDIKLPKPKAKLGFYRDIAVIAFPLDDSMKAQAPISFLDAKLAVKELGGSATDCRFLLGNSTSDRSARGKGGPHIVRRDSVVELSSRMSKDDMLDWTVPSGKWAVMRIGYTCTGARVSTSSTTWQGLALDYLSRDAFDFYWRTVAEPILARAGHHVGRTLKYMETDSWECGGMNWTDGFEREFAREMGYDPVPYLAVLAGYVVDGMEATTAFLADFRKCIAHMIARNHYGRFAELAHARGMGIQPESAGPHAAPIDGILNYSYSDIVMSEFWAPSPHRPTPPSRFFVKQASSVAHVYGKRIVGAESFTTIGPHWNDPIGSAQKSAFDHEICSGLNRVYFHTFTTSPASMGLPGQEYFAGTHVNPRVTWWDESAGFIDYMRRTQAFAQSGGFVADILHYYGDHVPNIYPLKEADHAHALPGFDYDVADEQALLALKVDGEGRIVAPSGARYRVLTLPDHRVLSLAAIRKVDSLLKDGATVVGERPERCVSLVGGAKAQAEFAATAKSLWGASCDAKGVSAVGKGRLVTGRNAREYLLASGLKPDFAAKGPMDYAHYSFTDGDAYFVSSQTGEERDVVCEFRVVGRVPELWNPLTGEIRELRAFAVHDGVTSVPLRFDPFGAYLVVFRKPSGNCGSAKSNFADCTVAATLEGAWKVSFDPKWDGPENVDFPSLSDWTENADERIKYYSGKATYRKRFSFAKKSGVRYALRLGDVRDAGFARVRLNGRDLGVAWTHPFRLDATAALADGDNDLEVTVVNSWYNRVKGDQLHPKGKQHTKTNIRLVGSKGATQRLSSSGLLGPVQILVSQEAEEL